MSGTPIAVRLHQGGGQSWADGRAADGDRRRGRRGRVYLAPTPEMEAIALQREAGVEAGRRDLQSTRLGVNVANYGMTTFGDLFTPRQLVALTTFSDLVQEARERVKRDALAAACLTTASPCATAAPALRPTATRWRCILAFAVSKAADYSINALQLAIGRRTRSRSTFGRQAIPMTWDFRGGESLLRSIGGNFASQLRHGIGKVLEHLRCPSTERLGKQA